MKKLFPLSPVLSVSFRSCPFMGLVASIFLCGCTATQVRWDASKMRKDVMLYYNDEIMDNLIRAKYHLPFVHVDIQSLTSQGASQISGTIGGGETRTHNNSPVGVLANVLNTVTRPFVYSVTPQQSETLTITAAPALGGQTVAEASPTPLPELEITRTTETKKGEETTEVTTEKTLKPAPKPSTVTIYDLYEHFATSYVSGPDIRPPERPYVPGTLKRWGDRYYYYIDDSYRWKYYDFCRKLFTKGQATSLERQVEAARADVEAVKSQLATPEAPR